MSMAIDPFSSLPAQRDTSSVLASGGPNRIALAGPPRGHRLSAVCRRAPLALSSVVLMTIRNWPAAVAVAALVFVFGSVAVESSVSIDVAGRSLSAYRHGGILVPGVNRHVSSEEYVALLVDRGEFDNAGDVSR